MPVIRSIDSLGQNKDVRVLVTGFGPFKSVTDNPSWLAVKRLHNVILETEFTPKPVLLPSSFSHHETGSHFPQHLRRAYEDIQRQEVLVPTPPPERSEYQGPTRIHITSLHVPVTYPAVLDIVPKLHARPPILPHTDPLFRHSRPPQDGYDLVIHVGVGRSGGLRVEKRARRWGYWGADADDGLCPIGRDSERDSSERDSVQKKDGEDGGDAEDFERERLDDEGETADNGNDALRRGFGDAYAEFEDELKTTVNVDGLVDALRSSGFEHVSDSTNAGLYLCEFIYYCSLAESRRPRVKSNENSKDTRVLFVHCPPFNEPYSAEDVSEALKRVIQWIILEDTN